MKLAEFLSRGDRRIVKMMMKFPGTAINTTSDPMNIMATCPWLLYIGGQYGHGIFELLFLLKNISPLYRNQVL